MVKWGPKIETKHFKRNTDIISKAKAMFIIGTPSENQSLSLDYAWPDGFRNHEILEIALGQLPEKIVADKMIESRSPMHEVHCHADCSIGNFYKDQITSTK